MSSHLFKISPEQIMEALASLGAAGVDATGLRLYGSEYRASAGPTIRLVHLRGIAVDADYPYGDHWISDLKQDVKRGLFNSD